MCFSRSRLAPQLHWEEVRFRFQETANDYATNRWNRFAYDTMKVIPARTLWRFILVLAPEFQDWLEHQPSYVLSNQHPLVVSLHHRDAGESG